MFPQLAHKPMVENMPKNMALKNMSTYLRLYRWNRAVLRKMLCSPRNPSVFHPNSLSTEESIKQGVKYFSELLASSERLSVDLESVIQSTIMVVVS